MYHLNEIVHFYFEVISLFNLFELLFLSFGLIKENWVGPCL